MPRDEERNKYVTVTFARDSALFAALSADSAASGRSLGNIVPLRLADYYGLSEISSTNRRASSSAPVPPIIPPTTRPLESIALPEQTPPSQEKLVRKEEPAPQRPEESEPEYRPETARKNAAAALDNLDFY